MDRFIELVKNKISGDLTESGAEEFRKLLQSNERLQELYTLLFAQKKQDSVEDRIDAEKAYAVHVVKMQLQNQFE